MPLLEAGKVGCTGGAVWAGSDIFDIHLTGSMAHGAYPHEGIDPIVAAAAVIQALQSLVARETDAREAAVVSVCRITAGTAYNIIPDKAHLQGTIRTLSTAVRERLLARFNELVKAVATAYGCTAEIVLVQGAPVTTNNPTLERLFADRIGGLETVPFKPQMGAEDFSAFARRVPAAFLFLGVRNEERGIVHMIHTPRFDVEESVIPTAVQSMSEALLATARDWQTIAPQLS
jgi:amidohydrolase